MMKRLVVDLMLFGLVAVAAVGCHDRKPAIASAPPASTPPSAFPGAISNGPGQPGRPPEPPALAADSPITSTSLLPWNERTLDAINGPDSPLKPIFFAYDSDELDDAARRTLAGDADVLKTYKSWVITIEGHCDDRGTAEYNLALGDRRAIAARSYLLSLGIVADRIRTVSYGKEFPFDPGQSEAAFAKNRRAHFMLTSK